MLSACASSTPSTRPGDPIASCGEEALEQCEPVLNECRDDPSLGCSDPEDTENRSRSKVCVQRHAIAVACLRALEAAGLMRRPD